MVFHKHDKKKKTVNSNENSLISDTDFVDMPSISGKKKAAEPRQEKQNSIILNETNTSSGMTQQMQNLTIDVWFAFLSFCTYNPILPW